MSRIRRFLDRHRRKRRNPRVFRLRFGISSVSELECFQRFRFRPDSFRFLVDLLNRKIQPSTARTRAISTELQVLLSLRYFATGGVFRLIGDSVGISENCSQSGSSACRDGTNIHKNASGHHQSKG